jgi:hypothetical protein
MEIWVYSDFDREKVFDNEEDAYQDYLENEDTAYLEDAIVDEIEWLDLLHWAMDQEAFWEHFQDEITRARERNFEDTYACWDKAEYEAFKKATAD